MSDDWGAFVKSIVEKINISAKNQYHDKIDGIISDTIEDWRTSEFPDVEQNYDFEPAPFMQLTEEDEAEIQKLKRKRVGRTKEKPNFDLGRGSDQQRKSIAKFSTKIGKEFIIVKPGDFIISRNGKIKEVVNGNEQWVEKADDWQVGFIRTRDLGDTKNEHGYVDYANQIRKATPEEVAKAKEKAGIKETTEKKSKKIPKSRTSSTPTLQKNKKENSTPNPKQKKDTTKTEKPKIEKKISIILEGDGAEQQAQILMELETPRRAKESVRLTRRNRTLDRRAVEFPAMDPVGITQSQVIRRGFEAHQ